ncbi:MAG: Enoyl-CoA hydratase/carnithine racemase [Rhodobacteraceae bacterium HLUCCA12]|nr:MAG: Enoyl-CoA hydratase/carnithine racemase [Rhodobacteraceae bacterium HLUCCA12]
MIEREEHGPLWVLRLNRPDKANSLTRAMMDELVGHLEAANGVVEALVLTGTGSVFSAGADLDEARAGLATDPIWEELSGRIAALRCLSIAALNGTLAGGAFGMALACDIRLGVPEARFFYPVMKLGYLPQPSDPERLAALIGPARARMILMGGAKIDAHEALAWGLIDRIHPREALMDAAQALTDDACQAPQGHAARIKAMIPRVWSQV